MITGISDGAIQQRPATHDVVIVGAGAVGMTLALALNRLSRFRVLLLEAQSPPVAMPDNRATAGGRILALSWSSVQTLCTIGAWKTLSRDAIPMTCVHVSQQGWPGSAMLHARTLGLDALGWVVREPALRSALQEALQTAGMEVRYGERLAGAFPGSSCITLHLRDDSTPLTTSLLVGADGTDSSVRSMLALPVRRRNLTQHALVFTLRCGADLGTMAYERFLEEGVLGILPLGAQGAGCTYVADPQRIAYLAGLPEPLLLKAVDTMMAGRLYPEALLGVPRRFDLPWLMAQAITAPRAVLIGNAAHTLHPAAAQGFNLGLRDVAALALALARAQDPGEPGLLGAYAQERLADYRQTALWLQALLRLYGTRLPGLAMLRGIGLGLVDMAPALGHAVSLWGMGAGRPYLPALWQEGMQHAS